MFRVIKAPQEFKGRKHMFRMEVPARLLHMLVLWLTLSAVCFLFFN